MGLVDKIKSSFLSAKNEGPHPDPLPLSGEGTSVEQPVVDDPAGAPAEGAEQDGAQCAPYEEKADGQEEKTDSGQAGMTTEEGTDEPQGETTAALDETRTDEPGHEEKKDSGQAGMTAAERPAGWDTMARVNPAFKARG